MVVSDWRTKELRKLFEKLEFRTLLRHFDDNADGIEDHGRGVKYKTVADEKALKSLLKEMNACSRFAYDTETTSTDPNLAELVGLSVSIQPGRAFYIPVNYFVFAGEEPPGPDGRSIDELESAARRVLDMMREPFEGGPAKIAQHAKYDGLIFYRHGIEVKPLGFDPMIADYLLNPAHRGHGIDDMALRYLNIRKVETSELIGKGKSQITMDRVPLETVSKYACEDADVALRLTLELEPRIEDKNLNDLLYDVELPLSDVLMHMERRGIGLDVPFLADISRRMRLRMEEITEQAYKEAGTDFNLNSPKQLSHIFFEKLNLPTRLSKKTKSGFSTDQTVLERLAPLHPLPRMVLEHRGLQKLVGTYVDALPQMVNPKTGRIHTNFSQVVASTGRLSSNDPNLQNIPIRTEEGAEIRRAFIADEGRLLMSADYSQIELRMMAHLSGDEGLIDAFERGEDIHRATAAKVFKLDPEEVSREQRSSAKAVNFGVLFGMREWGLSSRLGISVQEAREFIEGYFGAFPKVERYIQELLELTRKRGYVQTILGRRRPVPELDASNQNVRQAAERITIATAVQGSAADLIKVAMIRMHEELVRRQLPWDMLLQVHDELIFEVPENEVEDAAAWARGKMESAMKLTVPLLVEPGWGPNWLEAH
ncbi:DNA polymerase I [bacterium]|nr:DNA polymerase I [bacterium]